VTVDRVEKVLVSGFLGQFCISFKCIPLYVIYESFVKNFR